MGVVENQQINQTARVEGELSTFSLNEQLRKISEWWSRLKDAVTIPQEGGGIFTAGDGTPTEPSVRFVGFENSGLFFDPGMGSMNYTFLGTDMGQLVGDNFATHVKRTSNQTIGYATWTTVVWATTRDFNEGGMWDPDVSTSYIAAPADGIYFLSAHTKWSGTPGNPYRALVRIQKNNADIAAEEVLWSPDNGQPGLGVSCIVWADRGDTFRVRVYQTWTASGTLNATYTGFQGKRIG